MCCVFHPAAGSQERGSDFREPCLTERHGCVLQTRGGGKGGRTEKRYRRVTGHESQRGSHALSDMSV